jgi:hypothetical protein
MAPEVKPAKNSKLPKLPENYFEPVGKGGWPPISTWIKTISTSPYKHIVSRTSTHNLRLHLFFPIPAMQKQRNQDSFTREEILQNLLV